MRLHVGRLLKPARELCSVRSLFSANGLIDVNPEVSAALHANEAVVALESTIITHGMPYPKNLETALRVEEIIRSQGAIPATVAVMSGRVKAGLTQSQLELLAQTPATKTSRRDLANVVMAGGNGGTTVAGTMVVAAAVGINVFVTGGIGGVHRGGESSMDVSADLSELARSPVAVVCAGVKAILDIPRTLEYLETQGVCVAALGPDPDFPAFYSRSSGLRAPVHARDVHVAARLVDTSLRLRLGGGVLLATPIPSEHDIPREEMERLITVALREASEQHIVGKEITPFLLARVNQLTEGRSLSANIALVENNALVGAQVALALSEIQRSRQRGDSSRGWVPSFNEPKTKPARELSSDPHSPASVVVVGGSVVDCVISVQDKLLKSDGSTHTGAIGQAGGGVGRNLADALAKLGVRTALLSAVGDDAMGEFLRKRTLAHVDLSGLLVSPGQRTASYACVLDSTGECVLGVGDMSAHALLSPAHVATHAQRVRAARLVVADGNIGADAITAILKVTEGPVWFEPTDVQKASKPFVTEDWKKLAFISPNFNELKAMAKTIGVVTENEEFTVGNTSLNSLLKETLRLCKPIVREGIVACVTLGAQGIMIVRMGLGNEAFFRDERFLGNSTTEISARHYAVDPVKNLCNVSGAGDCFAAGFITAMLKGETEQECVAAGFSSSKQALLSVSAVPDVMTQPRRTSARFTNIM